MIRWLSGDMDTPTIQPQRFSLPQILLTHRQILHAVWGPAYGDDVDSLRMCIRAVRQKIEVPAGPDGKRRQHITTEYGIGYRFS